MSTEAKRQVGIKTRAVKRLAADVKSYVQEKSVHQSALDRLSASSSAEAHELRRAREFVDEAESTIQDVRQRLQEAYNNLQKLLVELEQGGDAELLADQCFADARQMLEDTASMVTVVTEEQSERGFKVTVLGASQLTEDDAMWRPAEELGERLAREGYHLLTGGYAGTAESVSFGASRVCGACVEGVTCPSALPSALPSQYLSAEVAAADLLDRSAQLVRGVDAVLVLPGALGTLSKLLAAWNLSAADSWQSRPPLALLAWRQPWEALLSSLGQSLGVSPALLELVTYVDSVEGAMQELDQRRQQKRNNRTGAQSSSSTARSA